MRRNYVQITATALACAALVLVMAACGSEQPVLPDTETPVATTQSEQTTTQTEQMTTQQEEQTESLQEEQILQPEQTATPETQQWIDSLYNALIQDDAKTVIALLGDVDNARAHCASYEYAWQNLTFANPEGFLLTASDGTKFGVGIFDSSDDEYDSVCAFVSSSDDEYGFHCIYAGDHYVDLHGDGTYAYLKGNDLIYSQDGVESVLYSCEPGGEVESWY